MCTKENPALESRRLRTQPRTVTGRSAGALPARMERTEWGVIESKVGGKAQTNSSRGDGASACGAEIASFQGRCGGAQGGERGENGTFRTLARSTVVAGTPRRLTRPTGEQRVNVRQIAPFSGRLLHPQKPAVDLDRLDLRGHRRLFAGSRRLQRGAARGRPRLRGGRGGMVERAKRGALASHALCDRSARERLPQLRARHRHSPR